MVNIAISTNNKEIINYFFKRNIFDIDHRFFIFINDMNINDTNIPINATLITWEEVKKYCKIKFIKYNIDKLLNKVTTFRKIFFYYYLFDFLKVDSFFFTDDDVIIFSCKFFENKKNMLVTDSLMKSVLKCYKNNLGELDKLDKYFFVGNFLLTFDNDVIIYYKEQLIKFFTNPKLDFVLESNRKMPMFYMDSYFLQPIFNYITKNKEFEFTKEIRYVSNCFSIMKKENLDIIKNRSIFHFNIKNKDLVISLLENKLFKEN